MTWDDGIISHTIKKIKLVSSLLMQDLSHEKININRDVHFEKREF